MNLTSKACVRSLGAWFGVLTILLTGCESRQTQVETTRPARQTDTAPPRETKTATTQPETVHNKPEKRPDAPDKNVSKPDVPASQPATAASQPATSEARKTESPPEYLTVIERVDSHKSYRALGEVSLPSRLVVTTDNVQRLRIDRRKLPFKRGRSVALLIDGQGIELTGRHDLVEIVRSRNGDWSPAQPITGP